MTVDQSAKLVASALFVLGGNPLAALSQPDLTRKALAPGWATQQDMLMGGPAGGVGRC